MKEKWNKVLKADGTTYYWIVRENKGANGWGNGYVALPPKHPWSNVNQFTYTSELSYDSYTGEPNNKLQIPYFERELTAGFYLFKNEAHRLNDRVQQGVDFGWAYQKKNGFTKDMLGYYVVGFYANHGEFDDMSCVLSDTIKLMDDADLFYRDYKTLQEIKKTMKSDIFFFDKELVRKLDAVVEEKFGKGMGIIRDIV